MPLETFNELEAKTSDIECEIHVPDTYRGHGFSGTTMREAVLVGDLDCFRSHLGAMFHDHESHKYYCDTRAAIVEGIIPIRRRTA